MIRLGVVGVQGAFAEHDGALRRALGASGTEAAEIVDLRRGPDAARLHGFVLPGGESTTMSKLLDSSGLRSPIVARVLEGAAVLGTCAGAILLSSRGDDQVARTGTRLLGLVDVGVRRNAFGRQKESFQAPLRLAEDPVSFPGVFIRAPAVADVGAGARPVAWLRDEVVGVQQGRRLALVFHPELSGDPRLHVRFIRHAAEFAAQEAAKTPTSAPSGRGRGRGHT